MSKEAGKHIWDYFIKTGESAKCSLCNSILKISQRSTTGLKYHLKSKHCIDLVAVQTSVQQPGTSTSKNDSLNLVNRPFDAEAPKNKIAKKCTLDNYLIKEHSKELMISRMVAKDGLSYNCLSTSEDLKYLFLKNGFSLPTSANTIKSIVENFSITVKAEIIKTLQTQKMRGEKFSLTFDEWTSVKNKRYLNLNVHHLEGTHFNLGLIPIHGSCNAEHCVELVKTRLKEFSLHLDADIIGITTDGASVMRKVGRLLGCYQQLCFAHGIQLAVVDTIYRKKSDSHSAQNEMPAVYSSDDDDDGSCDGEIGEEQPFSFAHSVQPPAELMPNYRGIIEKVRKVVKIFRKSPTKNATLQKYAQQDIGKDYGLILDCKTRWSSLFDMLERFNVLKSCTSKALIDIGSNITFSDDEWANIKELLLSLQPLKLGVEVLCRRNSTLLTADTTLRFILEKLDSQLGLQGRVAAAISTALRERIKERRTDLSGMALYLHNPKTYESYIKNPDYTFSVPKKNYIRLEIKKICERMLNSKDQMDKSESIIPESLEDEEITTEVNLSLKEELEMQLNKQKSDVVKVLASESSQNFDKVINSEMTEYENRGIKGKYLSLVQNYLNTIPPTSVEAERAFSAADYICSPLRNKMSDKTIDTICFLRSYFQNNK